MSLRPQQCGEMCSALAGFPPTLSLTYILAQKRNPKISFHDSIFKSPWMREINLSAGHQKERRKKKCNRLRPCGCFTNVVQRNKLSEDLSFLLEILTESADEKIMRRRSQHRRKHAMSRLPSSHRLCTENFFAQRPGNKKKFRFTSRLSHASALLWWAEKWLSEIFVLLRSAKQFFFLLVSSHYKFFLSSDALAMVRRNTRASRKIFLYQKRKFNLKLTTM